MFVTEDWYLCSHRLPVVRAAIDDGHSVLVLTHVADHGAEIRATGAGLVSVPLDRSSANPLKELVAFLNVVKALRRFKPDVVHNVALKPVIYGTIAGRMSGARLVLNAVSGLGELFMSSGGPVAAVLKRVLTALLGAKRGRILVQNPDDAAALVGLGLDADRIDVIRGSGVDLEQFVPASEPPGLPVRALFIGRLLRSKGLFELQEAASELRARRAVVQVEVAGDRDPHNPACVDEVTLATWKEDGSIIFHGHVSGMPSLIASCHMAVLPSYREGVPKALLEAAAVGRPIVTTDVPGNREVVEDGVNGILVPVRDPLALAAALESLANDEALRRRMGAASRAKAELEFSDRAVAEATLEIYRRVGER